MPRPKRGAEQETVEDLARRKGMTVIRSAQPGPPMPVLPRTGDGRLTGTMHMPIERVVPDPGQPRRDWTSDEVQVHLHELASSIQEFGILQPLIVREGTLLQDGTQQFVIIAGARRRAAAEMAGLSEVPVLVRDEEGTRIRILQLIENLQREDLNPIDEAHAFQELMELEGLSTVQLAARLHIHEQTVRDRLRLLIDQVFADAVRRRQVPASAVRELLRLPHDTVQEFRRRIERGDRLQVNDVLAARLELEAAGRTNPLRMGGRRKRPVDRAPRADAVESSPAPPVGAPAPSAASVAIPPTAGHGTAEVVERPPRRARGDTPDGGVPTQAEATALVAAGALPRPAERHPAATAAWAERLGELWLQWLGTQAPAIVDEFVEAMREETSDAGIPTWWEAVYHGIRRRIDEASRPA